MLSGQMLSGQMLSGQMVSGQMLSGQILSWQMLSGQILSWQMSLWQLFIDKDDFTKLLKKIGQGLVSSMWDIPDIEFVWWCMAWWLVDGRCAK